MSGMKTYPPVETARRTIQDWWSRVVESRFFHDRLSVSLISLALVVNLGALAWLVLRVRPTDVPVPVRYSNLVSGFDQLGAWHFPFLIAGYALVITILNTVFAYRSFNRSRLASFFLLAASTVVGAFGAIVATAFGAIR